MYQEINEDEYLIICDQCGAVIGDEEALSDNWGNLNCIELRQPDGSIEHFCSGECHFNSAKTKRENIARVCA